MLPTPCLICYRLNSQDDRESRSDRYIKNDEDKEPTENEGLTRFFQLLERHLTKDYDYGNDKPNEGDLDEAMQFPIEEAINSGFGSCGDCDKIVKSFCDLFHQMKSIELLLNWKLQTMKNIILCAHRLPSRIKAFRQIVDQMNSDVTADEIIGFKRNIITQCSRKLEASFPKLILKKYQHDKVSMEQTISTEPATVGGPQSVDESETEITKLDVPEESETDYDNEDAIPENGNNEFGNFNLENNDQPNIHETGNITADDPLENLDCDDDEGESQNPNKLGKGEESLLTSNLSLNEGESVVVEVEGNDNDLQIQQLATDIQHDEHKSGNMNDNVNSASSASEQFIKLLPSESLNNVIKLRYSPKDRKYKCTSCEKTFMQAKSCTVHYDGTHLGIRYACKLCNKKYSSESAFFNHLNSAHRDPTIPCQVCKKLFARKADLTSHHQHTTCRIGIPPKPKISRCICKLCGKGYTLVENLKKHMTNIHSRQIHLCDICGKGFTYGDSIRRHKRIFHPEGK